MYAASLIARRKRNVGLARAQSWLIATPRVSDASSAATFLLLILPLLWRLAIAVACTSIFSLNSQVTIEQSLQLSALITIGVICGALCGWGLSRPSATRRREGSRYTPRSKRKPAHSVPSSAALSHWPIAQALAWGRPENARLLLGAAILTVPGGSGFLAAVVILVAWIIGSYLTDSGLAHCDSTRRAVGFRVVALTPITFWAFAWPLARRALLHQLCGTAIAMGVMLMSVLSCSRRSLGTLWLTLVVLTAVLSLADCYRARSPA